MNIPSDDIINNLILKYISGDISDVEKRLLNDWIQADQENNNLFEEYIKTWDYAGKSIPTEFDIPVIDLDKEWQHQLDLVQKSERTAKQVSFVPQKTSNTWLAIAASITLIMVVSFVVFYLQGGFGTSYSAESISKDVAFKDGTMVTLNAGAEISYKRSYNKKARVVNFEGEAYFDVSPDTEKPFIIETKDVRIRVVGTSFNVRAIPDEELVEVIVTSGEVMLLNKAGDHAIALKMEDKGIFDRATGALTRINNDNANFLSWKTKNIEFENSSLEAVIETLNRIYTNKEIKLETLNTGNCSITVSFENQSIESILNVLESTLDLEYQIKGNTIEITSAGC